MIDENQVRSIANEVFDDRATRNQFGVSQIPAHAHTGVESLPVDPNDLVNASAYFALRNITLDSTSLSTLHGTPVVLIPAKGVTTSSTTINSFIVVEGVSAKLLYGGTAYTGTTNLEIRYTDSSGVRVVNDLPNSFLVSTSTAYQHASGTTSVFTPAINSPVVIVSTSPISTGNSNIMVLAKYRVVSL